MGQVAAVFYTFIHAINHYVGIVLQYIIANNEVVVPVVVFILLAILAWPINKKIIRWRVGKSIGLLKKIQSNIHKYNDAQLMTYLRSIDPYLFEELLLSALQQRGFKIVRSARYSGDGGIDGRFYIKGELVLVQAKRYTNHIKLEHVRDFVGVVKADKKAKRGLFIHTGRTGKASKSITKDSGVCIVSGELLASLLKGAPVDLGEIEL